ncbi:hypothetical protein TGME49_312175 [Toxoplasma gondii ME49]|uniref:Uncharacterized protein n=3 Tax=Toxoplasma gondii TaxID=5811 RepID=A0A125YGY0_TOXGV|nr:hypothetical protein TGME49_312175 [Toxoplasma gondii ME49]EPT26035.1 hypothetical protein TGME49_312175 [Toxoplasma gondii ME49]ESS35061.1 hypothetical protein TGVEG_312175 [Toxoplasma gondii VEG]KYF48050.1 hypothetical protein TGARI_312175 [Toxoplasma gondii ARI]CEL77479.1 TPA: hypothetical protein BN1205_096270 [Toxoplasma gondii VEG]|eukprot:XP_002364439.2 hypothetical protein TGME49_312175 [Toxoplasma gondii ME49]
MGEKLPQSGWIREVTEHLLLIETRNRLLFEATQALSSDEEQEECGWRKESGDRGEGENAANEAAAGMRRENGERDGVQSHRVEGGNGSKDAVDRKKADSETGLPTTAQIAERGSFRSRRQAEVSLSSSLMQQPNRNSSASPNGFHPPRSSTSSSACVAPSHPFSSSPCDFWSRSNCHDLQMAHLSADLRDMDFFPCRLLAVKKHATRTDVLLLLLTDGVSTVLAALKPPSPSPAVLSSSFSPPRPASSVPAASSSVHLPYASSFPRPQGSGSSLSSSLSSGPAACKARNRASRRSVGRRRHRAASRSTLCPGVAPTVGERKSGDKPSEERKSGGDSRNRGTEEGERRRGREAADGGTLVTADKGDKEAEGRARTAGERQREALFTRPQTVAGSEDGGGRYMKAHNLQKVAGEGRQDARQVEAETLWCQLIEKHWASTGAPWDRCTSGDVDALLVMMRNIQSTYVEVRPVPRLAFWLASSLPCLLLSAIYPLVSVPHTSGSLSARPTSCVSPWSSPCSFLSDLFPRRPPRASPAPSAGACLSLFDGRIATRAHFSRPRSDLPPPQEKPAFLHRPRGVSASPVHATQTNGKSSPSLSSSSLSAGELPASRPASRASAAEGSSACSSPSGRNGVAMSTRPPDACTEERKRAEERNGEREEKREGKAEKEEEERAEEGEGREGEEEREKGAEARALRCIAEETRCTEDNMACAAAQRIERGEARGSASLPGGKTDEDGGPRGANRGDGAGEGNLPWREKTRERREATARVCTPEVVDLCDDETGERLQREGRATGAKRRRSGPRENSVEERREERRRRGQVAVDVSSGKRTHGGEKRKECGGDSVQLESSGSSSASRRSRSPLVSQLSMVVVGTSSEAGERKRQRTDFGFDSMSQTSSLVSRALSTRSDSFCSTVPLSGPWSPWSSPSPACLSPDLSPSPLGSVASVQDITSSSSRIASFAEDEQATDVSEDREQNRVEKQSVFVYEVEDREARESNPESACREEGQKRLLSVPASRQVRCRDNAGSVRMHRDRSVANVAFSPQVLFDALRSAHRGTIDMEVLRKFRNEAASVSPVLRQMKETNARLARAVQLIKERRQKAAKAREE